MELRSRVPRDPRSSRRSAYGAPPALTCPAPRLEPTVLSGAGAPDALSLREVAESGRRLCLQEDPTSEARGAMRE